jgi:small subunit ribosomal protein S5
LSSIRDEEGGTEGQWVPKTPLGRMVLEGKVTSLTEIFQQGWRLREARIVDFLLPDLKDEVIDINLVQKQSRSGERSRFRALVVVGNEDGFVGLGVGKASRTRNAIEKAIVDAKLNISPVNRGCGSWECACGEPHSLPFKVVGRCGSVEVHLMPSPKGLGLVAGDTAKVVLRLAGVKDCWSKCFGATKTTVSFAYATFDALRETAKTMTSMDWAR